jgi:hypothetical protein
MRRRRPPSLLALTFPHPTPAQSPSLGITPTGLTQRKTVLTPPPPFEPPNPQSQAGQRGRQAQQTISSCSLLAALSLFYFLLMTPSSCQESKLETWALPITLLSASPHRIFAHPSIHPSIQQLFVVEASFSSCPTVNV